MKTVALIFGGNSCESDISKITALSVKNSIQNKCNVLMFLIKNNKIIKIKNDEKMQKSSKIYNLFFSKKIDFLQKSKILSQKIDCAVICCHGGEGENGILSGVMDFYNIPYTCCCPLQSSVCMDKVFTKKLLSSFHYPYLKYSVIRKGDKILSPFTYPVIIKPARQGSSIGITIAHNLQEYNEALELAFMYDTKILVEPCLENFQEFTCGAFILDGNIITSDVEEVKSEHIFYGFDEKYKGNDNIQRVFPAEIESKLYSKIVAMTTNIYRDFELKGVIRIDYLYKNNKLYVNEINTIPGSFSWYLFKNKGYSLSDIVFAMVDEAIKENKEKNKLITSYEKDLFSTFSSDMFSLGHKGDFADK